MEREAGRPLEARNWNGKASGSGNGNPNEKTMWLT